jgi:mannose-1-phosphate guanylyltransferase / mannose-6-phosphate isomerase
VDTIVPVVMSGGAGTRLWPASRQARPKQLHKLAGERTLLQGTLDRMGAGADGLFAAPVVVCNARYADQVRAQLSGLPSPARLILEPFGRNTAAVAACAALWMAREGRPDGLILLAPSDHLMAHEEAFRAAVRRAVPAARAGRLVTLGVTPTRPETGYGYIRMGAPLGDIFEAEAFVEKPDAATARAYLEDGSYVWNAGYFLFRADRMLEEMARLQPAIVAACEKAVGLGSAQGDDALLLDPDAFAACPSDSIDYAVMEKAEAIAVAPMDAGWSDLGSWQSVWEAADQDTDGNAVAGPAILEGAHGCLVQSDGPMVALVGVTDLVVVVSDGAVIVAPRDQTQRVKAVVDRLKAEGREDLL